MANTGLIGIGSWGKNILRNLMKTSELRSVCDKDEATLVDFSTKHSDIPAYRSHELMLKDQEIKAVFIASSAGTHYRLAKEFLIAGKDVFVEKPLALTVKEGEELVSIASDKKLILMVGHILNYHPAIIELKKLVSSGELGKIQYVYSNRLNIGKLRTEENILWSFAPHDISVILSLIGEDPVKVSAFGSDILNKDIFDTTVTTMEFSNNLKAHIFVSWLHPFKEQKLVVVGSKCMAVFDDVSEEKLFLYPHKIDWKNGKIPISSKAEKVRIDFPPGEPLFSEIQHFLKCVKDRSTPLTDGLEGLRVLKVLASCQGSLSGSPRGKKDDNAGDFFSHSTCVIDQNVKIGKGTKIWHFSHILSNSSIGEGCVFGQNTMVGPNVRVGNNVKVQNNVSIYDGVELEDDVFCGPSMVFTNVINPRSFINRKDQFRRTLVKRGATLGANSTIICGATIGEYAMVAAGAVVTKDLLPFGLYAGVPARRIGWICRCGVTLKDHDKGEFTCQSCSARYGLVDETLIEMEKGDETN